jgi:hypothetical protein
MVGTNLIRVRLLKSEGCISAGSELNWPEGLARKYVAEGKAEYTDPPAIPEDTQPIKAGKKEK